MKEIEPLKLSYSGCKIPVFPSFLFIFCIAVIICFLYSKLGLSEQEIKKTLSFVLVILSISWILLLILIRYRHSLIIEEKGVTMKDGKTKIQLTWGDIKRIIYSKEGVNCLEIETKFDSTTIFLPLQLFIKRYWDNKEKEKFFSHLDSFISKFNSGYLNLEENHTNKLTTYKPYIKSESYILQRKSNILIALIFSTLIVGFFLIFPMKMALCFSASYLLILLGTINYNYSKDDLVFDAAGITIYHKHDISFVSWENISNIEFITGERDTLIFYYKDDNKERKAKTWYISTIANVNGDIYDYFINVSKLRGKSAIDSYIIIKAKRNK